MPTLLLFGGSGKVARYLTKLLRAQNPPWTVNSIIRSNEQVASLSALGAKPIVQSIEESSVSDLASTITQAEPDVVVWSAGAGGKDGPHRTDAVDREGAIKVFDALAEVKFKGHFILVSAVDIRDRERKPVPDWYDSSDIQRSDRMWTAIGHYMRAKLAADIDLRTKNAQRNLKYTILRPGGLSEEPGTGRVAAGKVHLNAMIPREDVAATIFACIENPGTIGMAFDVVSGDVPITEAVKGVVERKEDTFEGFY